MSHLSVNVQTNPQAYTKSPFTKVLNSQNWVHLQVSKFLTIGEVTVLSTTCKIFQERSCDDRIWNVIALRLHITNKPKDGESHKTVVKAKFIREMELFHIFEKRMLLDCDLPIFSYLSTDPKKANHHAHCKAIASATHKNALLQQITKTLSHYVQENDLEMVRTIFEAVKPIPSSCLDKVLVLAVQHKNIEMVKLIFSYSTLNFSEAYFCDALMSAVNNVQTDIAQLFLESYRKTRLLSDQNMARILKRAIVGGSSYLEVVKSILRVANTRDFNFKDAEDAARESVNLEALHLIQRQRRGLELITVVQSNNDGHVEKVSQLLKQGVPLEHRGMALNLAIQNYYEAKADARQKLDSLIYILQEDSSTDDRCRAFRTASLSVKGDEEITLDMAKTLLPLSIDIPVEEIVKLIKRPSSWKVIKYLLSLLKGREISENQWEGIIFRPHLNYLFCRFSNEQIEELVPFFSKDMGIPSSYRLYKIIKAIEKLNSVEIRNLFKKGAYFTNRQWQGIVRELKDYHDSIQAKLLSCKTAQGMSSIKIEDLEREQVQFKECYQILREQVLLHLVSLNDGKLLQMLHEVYSLETPFLEAALEKVLDVQLLDMSRAILRLFPQDAANKGNLPKLYRNALKLIQRKSPFTKLAEREITKIFSFLSLDSIVACRDTCKTFAPPLREWGKSVRHLKLMPPEAALNFFKMLKVNDQDPFFPNAETLVMLDFLSMVKNENQGSVRDLKEMISTCELVYRRISFHCGSSKQMLLYSKSADTATSLLKGFKDIGCLTIMGIEDTTPELIAAVPKLEQLNLLDVPNAVHAAAVPQLTTIWFDYRATDSTLALYANHTGLRNVHINEYWMDNRVKRVTNVGLRPMLSLPNLETLELGLFDKNIFLENLDKIKKLRKLNLTKFSNTDTILNIMVQNQSSLRELSLHYCFGLGDAGCKAIAQFTELQYLSLGLNFNEYISKINISDEGLKALKQCKHLKKLAIYGNEYFKGITTKGVIDLVQELPLLTELDLTRCEIPGINVKEIKETLKKAHPSLYVKTIEDFEREISGRGELDLWVSAHFREVHPELSHLL